MASYRAAYRGLLPQSLLADYDIREREQRWRDSLREPANVTIVAEDATPSAVTLIAFAEIGPCSDADMAVSTGQLRALHVAERFWHQGIGSMLHRCAIQSLATRKFESAVLWVLRDNVRARAFYETVGWTRYGRERHRVIRGADVFEVGYRITISE
ncbi:GNAT family N-acetyltransferase [Actinoallomurus acanthiterrae]